jgi:hypothetical protein
VASVVEQESNFDPWAIRYERNFYLRYVDCSVGLDQKCGNEVNGKRICAKHRHKIKSDTELKLRAFS